MKSYHRFIFLFFSLFIIYYNAVAQKISSVIVINNINFVYKNEQVEITYDILGNSSSDEFTVSLSAFKSTGEKLNTLTVAGDIINIKSGIGKKIYWQQRKDGAGLDGNIYFILTATKKLNIPLGTHLAKSLVLPGWGDCRLRNKKTRFVLGLAGYSFIAASIYMNQQSIKTYENYKTSHETEQSNQLFNNARTQQKISYALAGAATISWTIDLAGIFSKRHKLKRNITPEASEYYYAKSQEQITGKSAAQYINTKTPYELAIERGDNYLIQENYLEAKTAYEEALALKSEEELPRAKLNTINNILIELKNKGIAYTKKINEGKELFGKSEYEKAIVEFKEAKNIKPKEKYPDEMIKACNLKIDELAKQVLYKQNMENGDYASAKNYETAKSFYEVALSNKPYDETAIEKIEEMKIKLEAIELAKKNKQYEILIIKADNASANKKYEEAKALYEEASYLGLNKEKPDVQINKIEAILLDKENKRIDKEYKSFLDKGDIALKNREYDKAREYYSQASALKSNESYPKNQIEKIDGIFNMSKSYGSKDELFNNCEKAVFLIYSESYWGDASTGTGFFITSDGIAISNYHVYNKYNNAVIYTGGYIKSKEEIDKNKLYEIETVLEENESKDYVIFRIKKKYSSQKFCFLKIASSQPKILENVLAIGNPKSFLKVPSSGEVKQFLSYKDIDDFYILTNVDVTHGNSGGPLLNLNGEVIGIMTMAEDHGRLGLNYAINIIKLSLGKYVK